MQTVKRTGEFKRQKIFTNLYKDAQSIMKVCRKHGFPLIISILSESSTQKKEAAAHFLMYGPPTDIVNICFLTLIKSFDGKGDDERNGYINALIRSLLSYLSPPKSVQPLLTENTETVIEQEVQEDNDEKASTDREDSIANPN